MISPKLQPTASPAWLGLPPKPETVPVPRSQTLSPKGTQYSIQDSTCGPGCAAFLLGCFLLFPVLCISFAPT